MTINLYEAYIGTYDENIILKQQNYGNYNKELWKAGRPECLILYT